MDAEKKNETKAAKPAEAKANGKPTESNGKAEGDPAKGAALKAASRRSSASSGRGR